MVCLIDYYLNAGGKTIMDNAYGYDVVSNVLSVVNKAAIPEKGKAGGQMSYNYTYDALYRLSTASGTYKGADNKAASYTLSMGYDNMHRITSKKQHLSQTGVQFDGTLNAGYDLTYTYQKGDGKKFQLDNVRDINYRTEETPTESMNINNGHKYTYDLNGNLVYINTSRVKRDGKEDEKATEQKYRWGEENRLMVLSDNSKTSRYTYNAAGERIMKNYGTMEGVCINGAPQGITLTNVDFRLHQDKMSKLFCAWFALKFHETDNFTLYPASILSVNKNRFTKHYFLGDKRIASKIGTGLFNNVYGRNGSYVTAGQQDYAERMNQIQTQKEAYYKKVGVAPGVPTEKGAYGDPENTGVGYNAVLTELGNHDVPQGWIQTPRPNTTPNTNPGPPVSWNDPSNPDDPQAGYGYIANDTTKEETFYYHSDHLGSTSYITDDKANITQYDAYLPYGELLVDEHSSSEDLPYKFNGKQFDEETGLYYYGARYMNPITSLWYGVDPLAEKFPNIGAYVYCHGNPINMIDPDGKDDYKLNKNGQISFWRRTNAKTTDRIFSGKSHILINKGLASQLVKNQTRNGTIALTNKSDDAFKFFKFVADNTNVEWNLIGERSDNGGVVFKLNSDFQSTADVNTVNAGKFLFMLHSHPWGSNEGVTRASGNYNEYKNTPAGELVKQYYRDGDVWTLDAIYGRYRKDHLRQTLDNYPKAFIYYAGDSKQAKQLYQYNLQKSKINPIFNPSYQRIRKYVYR